MMRRIIDTEGTISDGDEEWKGSSVKVTSTYGTIRIMYADEMSSSKSILGTLRSWVSL